MRRRCEGAEITDTHLCAQYGDKSHSWRIAYNWTDMFKKSQKSMTDAQDAPEYQPVMTIWRKPQLCHLWTDESVSYEWHRNSALRSKRFVQDVCLNN